MTAVDGVTDASDSLDDAPPLAPDRAHDRLIADQAHLHQVGAQAGRDLAAIVESRGARRVQAHGGERLRNAEAGVATSRNAAISRLAGT